jgi:hypothetical protein
MFLDYLILSEVDYLQKTLLFGMAKNGVALTPALQETERLGQALKSMSFA